MLHFFYEVVMLKLNVLKDDPLAQDPCGRVEGADEVRTLIFVGAVADAHGHSAVTAPEPATLPQQFEVLPRGADFQQGGLQGVVRLIPIEGDPHPDLPQPGEGGLVQNVQRHAITSGRMPEYIG